MQQIVRHNTRLVPLLLLIICGLGLFTLLPQLTTFHNSLYLLKHPYAPYVIAAVAATLLSYVAGAVTYYLIAWRPLQFRRLVLVELAAMFLNRLMPSGIGGLGANYAYLRHERHTASQATVVVAINNLLGVSGHLILLISILSLSNQHAWRRFVPKLSAEPWQLMVLIIPLAITGVMVWRFQFRLQATGQRLWRQLLKYRHRRLYVGLGLLSSIALTLSNLACLEFCALALHVTIPPAPLLLIFSFGITIGTSVPTPGGVGGVEAGLVVGLIANHVPANQALAIALLYRLVSYWFMLLLGALSFAYCLRTRNFTIP